MCSSDLGSNNVYNTSAISAPSFYNGIANGNGNGASYTTFNNAINSSYGTGFVDTNSLTCNAYINHRTGAFTTTGTVTAGSVSVSNTISSSNICDLAARRGFGIFIINGTSLIAMTSFIVISQSTPLLSSNPANYTFNATGGTAGVTGNALGNNNYSNQIDMVGLPYGWGIIGYNGDNYTGNIILNVGNFSSYNMNYVRATSDNAIRSAKVYFNGVQL
jgi:hypothetical protein